MYTYKYVCDTYTYVCTVILQIVSSYGFAGLSCFAIFVEVITETWNDRLKDMQKFHKTRINLDATKQCWCEESHEHMEQHTVEPSPVV